MNKYIFTLILACAFAVISPQIAFGQWDYGQDSIYNIIESRIDARRTMERIRENNRKPKRPAAASGRQRAGAGKKDEWGVSTVKNVARGTTTFSSSGSLVIPKEFAREIGKTGQGEREAEAKIIKHLTFFDGFLKYRGYAANDVARTSSMIFVECLSQYLNKDLTQEQKNGVYAAFKDLYETDEYFQSLSNTEKQKNYETQALLWSFVADASIAVREKGDGESKRRLKNTAENIFKQFVGFPITDVRLTAGGFEID